MNLKVLKFGGTSMGTPGSLQQCNKIAVRAAKASKIVVVVSALGGVTNQLIELIELARKQKPKRIAAELNIMEQKHKDMLAHFVAKNDLEEIWQREFANLFKKLRLILTGTSLVGDITKKSYAIVCSFGEQLSSRIMCHALEKAGLQSEQIDAKRIIRTDSNFLEATVDLKRTKLCSRRTLLPLLEKKITPVVTGFIGKDASGQTTLLGRGGSDYTASLVAMSLGAEAVEIWTDVDGIMSADPRIVKEGVKTWRSVELPIVAEMAHSGAKVLHPKTITAAVEQNIPVFVKNTFNPSAHGTEVVQRDSHSLLRGITMDKEQAVFHFAEPGMLATPGFIRHISEIFEQHNVSIDACFTSEVSFTCSIHSKHYSKKLHQDLSKIAETTVYRNLAKVCVIGHNISKNPDLLAQIMTVLKGNDIYAVSIGTTFHNITLLIDEEKADNILRSLHASLFSSSNETSHPRSNRRSRAGTPAVSARA
jgi:aspartate kinase